MTPTEYSFTLPIGFTDHDGALHRQGTMRLATARDEIEPLRDARVRENPAYLNVLRLARVVTRLGDTAEVTPQLVEQLYSADFDHLQRLYGRVNAAQPPAPSPQPPPGLAGVSDTALRWMLDERAPTLAPEPTLAHEPTLARMPATEQAPAAELAPPAEREYSGERTPAADYGWPEGLPIGLRQEQERMRSRAALMRSSAAPRRGRVEEGGGLMRFSSVAPDAVEPDMSAPDAVAPDALALERPPAVAPAAFGRGAADMEELCEELIARLRRELLIERERMGTLFGA